MIPRDLSSDTFYQRRLSERDLDEISVKLSVKSATFRSLEFFFAPFVALGLGLVGRMNASTIKNTLFFS